MTRKTSKDRPQATARAAEIVREYGPSRVPIVWPA